MTSVRLTVAVAAYQVESSLRECLDSLLCQRGSLEILCVDDASTDGTPAILREYAAKDPRVRVLTHADNKGTYQTRADAAQAARGELITYVDGDDRLAPGACERLLQLVDETGVECLAFGFHCFADEEAVKSDPELAFRLKDYSEHLSAYQPCRLEGEALMKAAWVDNTFPNTACAKVFRTEAVRRCCEKHPDGRYRMGEDQFFCFRFYAECASAAYVAEPLYEYRMGLGISTNPHDHSIERFEQICRQLPLVRFTRRELEKEGRFEACRAAWEKYLERNIHNIHEEWGVMLAGPDRAAANRLVKQYCLPELKRCGDYEARMHDRTDRIQRAEKLLQWKGPLKKVGTLLFCLYRWGPKETIRILRGGHETGGQS